MKTKYQIQHTDVPNPTKPTMEASQLSPQSPKTGETPTYRFEYTWYNFKGRIYDDTKPGEEPIYIADFAKLRRPHAIYKRVDDDKIIGTGTVHYFKLDTEYESYGRKDTLVAQKRFRAIYTHRSPAMSDTEQPVTMTWTSESGFKEWDFVCVDENQMPVARFSMNPWRMAKMGTIEFTGPKADSQALREELIVAGITLAYHIMVRSSNFFSVAGALFASPGHDKERQTGPKPAATDGAGPKGGSE